jgi:hypothetical protein
VNLMPIDNAESRKDARNSQSCRIDRIPRVRSGYFPHRWPFRLRESSRNARRRGL